jgi:hypothetical protein
MEWLNASLMVLDGMVLGFEPLVVTLKLNALQVELFILLSIYGMVKCRLNNPLVQGVGCLVKLFASGCLMLLSFWMMRPFLAVSFASFFSFF